MNSDEFEILSPGARPGCTECGLEDCNPDDIERIQLAEEPGFSWSPCDLCGSSLGGDRHPAHGVIGDEIFHLDICTDCLMKLT